MRKLLNKILFWDKLVVGLISLQALIYGNLVYAAAGSSSTLNIGGVADNVKSNFKSISELIGAGSYIGGLGFIVAAILKLKAHKDNPQQVHLSHGMVLLLVGFLMVFAPAIIRMGGLTLFGGISDQGNNSGSNIHIS